MTYSASWSAQATNRQENEALLAELDRVIVHKQEYQAARQAKIDSIKRAASTCKPYEYVNKYKELYAAAADFNGKQAMEALEQLTHSEQYASDLNLQAWVKLNKSSTYATMGLYHKANALINEVVPSRLSQEEQLHYYCTRQNNAEKISEYMSDVDLDHSEGVSSICYFDSILSLLPEGAERNIALVNKLVHQGYLRQALELALTYLPEAMNDSEQRELGITMAYIYDGLGKPENSTRYLTLTAINDIKSGNTEYQALQLLAHTLYEQKDIDHAYEYLMCTMEDANIYPSRSLALDVSRYFPLINQSYSKHKSFIEMSEKMKRDSYVITYILLVLAIIVAVYLGWRYNNTKLERKRANELQKALDQAAIADRIKTVFIQNMRHEIRTPLNAIMGFAQLMSNDLSEEERSLYNSYIRSSNNQLLSTLDDIIDVSNMEVGTFNFHFDDVNVDELCKLKMEETKELQPQNVTYTYQPYKKGLHFYSDGKRIGQVLHNLLSNACKNTTSGSITLSVARDASGDNLQFVVTDTGCGIPADKTELIFEHFEKIDHYSPGLGLGLYVCRLIARALGGDICLDTTYTQGARFVFTVPSCDSAPAMPLIQADEKPSVRSYKQPQRPARLEA